MGALGGLALGLGLALLLEYRDRTLRTEADLLGAFSLPVLALVPTMGVQPRKKRRRFLRAAAAAGLVGVCLSLVFAWRLGLTGL